MSRAQRDRASKRIVLQEDFYEDTQRIAELEARLTERGVRPCV